MEQPVAAAPAQPETISATRDAANRGDFNAFDKADHAARTGKPLSDVAASPEKLAAVAPAAPEPPAVTEPPASPERAVSRRQQDVNDRIREAVDRATADLRAELARLQPVRTADPAAPSAPAPTKEAEYKRFLAMPDAPKLDQFESIEEHNAAMALFVADKRHDERESARQQSDRQQRTYEAHEARLTAFDTRVADAKAKDPAFLARVQPIASQLEPTASVSFFNAALERGEVAGAKRAIGPLNTLADEIIESEHSTALLDHFQAHPDEFDAFKTMRHPRDVTRRFAQIEASIAGTAAPAPATPSPTPRKFISDAPPPAPIISTPHTSADPKQAAIARGDFATFDKIEMQEKRQRHAS